MRNPLHNTALRYAIVVGLWILIIDFLSDRLISDGRWFLALHAGLALFTFLVLYALLKRELAARQQAETHRRVSEERLANILSTAADAIIAVDQDLEIIVFNRAAETIFGYQVDKVIGQPLDILIPGRYAEVYRQYFQTFVRSSETSHQMHQYQEVFARRKNGTEFPAEVSLSKLIQHGQSTITMIVRDVTIRRQAIEALQWAKDDLEQRIQDRTASLAKANIALQTEIQERARAEKEREVLLLQVEQERQNVQALANTLERERDILHIIMENTRTQLAYLDSQFNYVRVNSAYALGSGHREEEFIGRNHFELFPNLENKAIFEQVRETGQPVQFLARPFEYVGQPERGTTYWDWTLVPVAAGEGLVQGLVLSLLEVTELKQAEEALRQAYGELELRIQERTRALAKANEELRTENAERRQVEQQLRIRTTALEAAANGIIITDRQGNILWANPAFTAMTGYSIQAIAAQNPRFLKSDQHDASFYKQLWQTILAGEVWHGEIINRRQDGRLYQEEQTITPVFDESNSISHFIAIKQDITERVEARQLLEQRVQERTRELSTLLEISSHMALTVELESRLRLILDSLRAVVAYDHAAIYNLEDGRLNILVQRNSVGQQTTTSARFPLELTSLGEEVMRGGKPTTILDTQGKSPRARAFQAVAQEHLGTNMSAIRSWLGIPLFIKERAVGLLDLQHSEPDRYTLQQIELALAFANQAAVAIENHRLYQQAQELAAMEERQRLARELHDAVSQTLFSASLAADVLPQLWQKHPDQRELCLAELRQLTKGALAEMRALLLELRPTALVQSSLDDLLRQLAEAVTSRARVPVALYLDQPGPLPAEVQVALYRITQEALNNIVKHAEASRAGLTLRCDPPAETAVNGDDLKQRLELRIWDDGRGFDFQSVQPHHLGLKIFQERAEAIGATFRLEGQPGNGTEITVVWPGTP